MARVSLDSSKISILQKNKPFRNSQTQKQSSPPTNYDIIKYSVKFNSPVEARARARQPQLSDEISGWKPVGDKFSIFIWPFNIQLRLGIYKLVTGNSDTLERCNEVGGFISAAPVKFLIIYSSCFASLFFISIFIIFFFFLSFFLSSSPPLPLFSPSTRISFPFEKMEKCCPEIQINTRTSHRGERRRKRGPRQRDDAKLKSNTIWTFIVIN